MCTTTSLKGCGVVNDNDDTFRRRDIDTYYTTTAATLSSFSRFFRVVMTDNNKVIKQ